MPARQRAARVPVRFDDAVWREAIRGFAGRSLQIATAARTQTKQHGVAFDDLLACQAVGPDATELAGCAKLYLPFLDAPPSQRPFAFVLQLARDTRGGLVWVFIAFGHRHPPAGVRSVYQRAHRQLHGRFPTT